jgi:hypothetical protein
MDLDTALDVFREIESLRWKDLDRMLDPGDDDWNPPIYSVRLDADEDRDDGRTFRIYVRMAVGSTGDEDDFRFILDLAKQHDLNVSLDNNGINLR